MADGPLMTTVQTGQTVFPEAAAKEPTDNKKPSKALSKKKLPSNFRCLGSAKELHSKPIYCVAWSTDTYHDDGLENDDVNGDDDYFPEDEECCSKQQPKSAPRTLRTFATCGANQVSVYEVEMLDAKQTRRSSGILLRQGYLDADEEETYYSCAFGGTCLGKPFGYSPLSSSKTVVIDALPQQSSVGQKRPRDGDDLDYPTLVDTTSYDGPELLLVAGTRGVIKVIDIVRKMLVSTLSGHGDDIYDLKFSPTDPWLLLSASKDESMRLWNVQTCTCLAIFAGHEGHRDSVLSVAWHPLGDRIVSAGMDTTVKLWNVGHIPPSTPVAPKLWSATNTKPFRTVYEQMPYFSTNKVHTNYVDSVQFVGDLVLSKDTHDKVVLWYPELSKTTTGKSAGIRLPSEVVALREFSITKCNVWFVRFGTDVNANILAVGNTLGEIKLWDIGPTHPTKKYYESLVHPHCYSTVRMVALSPDSKFLVSCCDDASVWLWEPTPTGAK
jgi:polycomb protein EED